MKKKSLLKKIFGSRKKKKKKFKIGSKKVFVFNKVKLLFRKYKSLTSIFLKKAIKSSKANDIKKFFIMITGYGLILNYSFHFIFGTKFNILTMFAWGIMYFFISEEFVEWFRRLIARR
jgi:hypothetical protein